MKSAEEVVSTTDQRRLINVTEEVQLALKTMDHLQAKFGVSYLARIIRGDAVFQWKNPQHMEIETFGCLHKHHQGWVKNLLYKMADLGIIKPELPRCSVVSITPEGREWMENPTVITMPKSELRVSRLDYLLRYKILELRKQIAETENTNVYTIFTEFTIDMIVRERPLTYSALRIIPGIDDMRADRYGAVIVSLVRESEEERRDYYLRKLHFDTGGKSFQETKDLFLEGKSVKEIAEIKGVKERTVLGYLEKLHITGQIDFRPWIEENVDSKMLYKAVEFFRQVQFPKMGEAQLALGTDFDTLRLCKVYALEPYDAGKIAKQA